MTDPTENSEFCFPSLLPLLLPKAKDLGETKLTVSLGASGKVLIDVID